MSTGAKGNSVTTQVKGNAVFNVQGADTGLQNERRKEIFNGSIILKNLFQDYEVIAGWYSFMAIIMGTTQVIQSLTTVVLRLDSSTDGLGELAMGVLPTLLISCFGEHFRSVVSVTRLKMFNLYGTSHKSDVILMLCE